MIDSKSQAGDAQFTRELPDNELEIVTGGVVRKAGETPVEYLPISNPPTPIEAVIGWIKGLFN